MTKIKGFVILLLLISSCFVYGQHWEGVGGGTDLTYWTVQGLYVHDLKLHVCGGFDSIAGSTIESPTYGIWDGMNWYASNINFYIGGPTCFIEFQGLFYMAGTFRRVNGNKYCRNIAYEDSTGGWLPLGSGVTNGSGVKCMASYNGDLFIGGQFTEVDSTIAAWRIARWDGTDWHAMGTGITGGFGVVSDMAVFQNELYVGGDFGYIDGLHAPGICKWNGTNWDTVGNGIGGPVDCFYVDSFNNRLYVGGHFGSVGGLACPTGVAYWDGSNWFPVGTNPYLPAKDLIIYNGILYNLSFELSAINTNGDTIDYAAWYDGVNWNPVPGGLSSTGNCFAIYQNELYVGGYFQYAGDSLVNGIAKWIPGSLGTHEIAKDQLRMEIMPNPAKDEIIVELDGKFPPQIVLNLTDFSGKTVLTETLIFKGKYQHIIRTSTLSAGTYFVTILSKDNLVVSEKVVIYK